MVISRVQSLWCGHRLGAFVSLTGTGTSTTVNLSARAPQYVPANMSPTSTASVAAGTEKYPPHGAFFRAMAAWEGAGNEVEARRANR